MSVRKTKRKPTPLRCFLARDAFVAVRRDERSRANTSGEEKILQVCLQRPFEAALRSHGTIRGRRVNNQSETERGRENREENNEIQFSHIKGQDEGRGAHITCVCQEEGLGDLLKGTGGEKGSLRRWVEGGQGPLIIGPTVKGLFEERCQEMWRGPLITKPHAGHETAHATEKPLLTLMNSVAKSSAQAKSPCVRNTRMFA